MKLKDGNFYAVLWLVIVLIFRNLYIYFYILMDLIPLLAVTSVFSI